MILLHAPGKTLALRNPRRPRPSQRFVQPLAHSSGGVGIGHDYRAEEQTIGLDWPHLDQGAAADLRAFCVDEAKGMANAFSYSSTSTAPLSVSDGEGGGEFFRSAEGWFLYAGPAGADTEEYTVRLAEPELRMTERPGGAVECSIVLLKEPA